MPRIYPLQLLIAAPGTEAMNKDASVKFFHSQGIIILMIFTLHVHPQAMRFGHTDGSRRARYDVLELVDLGSFAASVTVELPYGRKRALEIATTLAMEPELMLLDEPTAGMGHEDVDRVKELIRKVAANRTILMVEHNMSVVAGICDTISVLQRGSVLAEGPYAEVSKNPGVIEAYMGTVH